MYDSYGQSSFSWIKFFILLVPFLVLIWWVAPSLKWKVVFSFGGVIGIWLALIGKSMKGLTPVGRKF